MMILLIILLSLSVISFPHQINGIIEFGQIMSEPDWQNDEFWNFETQTQATQLSARPSEHELLYGQNCIELDELWPNHDESQSQLQTVLDKQIPHKPYQDISNDGFEILQSFTTQLGYCDTVTENYPNVDKIQDFQRKQVADPSNRCLQNLVNSLQPLQDEGASSQDLQIAESSLQIIRPASRSSHHLQNAEPSSQNIQDKRPSFQRPSNKDIFSLNKLMLFDHYQRLKNKRPQMTEQKIAEELKIPRSTLYYLRKSKGIQIKSISGIKYFTVNEQKEMLMECAKLKRENPRFSDMDCAAKFGIHPTTIYIWRKKHNIPVRKCKKIDEKEFAKIYNEIKDQNQGIMNKDMAKMMNLPEYCLSYRKKIIGQQKPKRSTKHFTADEQKEMLMECAKLKRENPKFKDVDCAAKFGIDPTTIYIWRKKHGFTGVKLQPELESHTSTVDYWMGTRAFGLGIGNQTTPNPNPLSNDAK